jgi:exoribonuclease R
MKYFDKYNSLDKSIVDKIYKSGTLCIDNKHISNIFYITLDKTNEVQYIRICDPKTINRSFVDNQVLVEITNTAITYDDDLLKLCYTEGKIVNNYDDKTNKQLLLIGTLLMNSIVSYGKNKKGMMIYQFIPDDRRYPKFMIPSSYKRKNMCSNVYVQIKFKEWTVDMKYPSGMCEFVIGETGDKLAEMNRVLYKFDLKPKEYNGKEMGIYVKDLIDNRLNPDSVSFKQTYKRRLDKTNLFTFSIDPPGCKDIDDAFSIEQTPDYIEIGIHIADVSYYVKDDDYIDNMAKSRCTSVYAPHKQINMLPDTLAENICSLLPGEERYALSVFLRYDPISFNVIDNYVEFEETRVQSNYAFDYDTIDNYLATAHQSHHKDSRIMQALDILRSIVIYNNKSKQACETIDSHKIVEYFMIKANLLVAYYMSHHISNALYRNHLTKNTTQYTDQQQSRYELYLLDNSKLRNYLDIILMNAAEYSVECKGHLGLDIQKYTHFTSPIRRYSDVIVHRLVKYIRYTLSITNCDQPQDLYSKQYLTQLCVQLNKKNKNTKKADRYFSKLQLYFIEDQTKLQNLEAYIIDCKTSYVTLYIPAHNMSFKSRVISSKVDNLITYEINDEQESKFIYLTNKQTTNQIMLQMFHLIKVTIIPDFKMLNDNKVRVKINQPDISSIFV